MIILPKPQYFELKKLSFSLVNYKINYVKSDLIDEQYRIIINPNEFIVEYGTDVGKFRAMSTVKQILAQQSNNQIQCMEIYDYPSIKNRGLMLDVSRGKVPKYETLIKLIDMLADLKYNQLQLYFDNFIFEYNSFKDYYNINNVITVEEIKKLDTYCKEHFIELVPNQNGLGHMGPWISKDEFKNLAITNDKGSSSTTLNPLKEESIKLIDRIYGDLICNFSSDKIHIGLDEPWELGMGETKEECNKIGISGLLLNYINKINNLVNKKYNKTAMMWDDFIMKHPERINELPNNVIYVEWGYEQDHKFDRHCAMLKNCGKRFYVAPGASSWGSICGRTTNMIYNIQQAAEVADNYGAEGFLLTDWGDYGTLQFPVISYFAYAFAASYSWNCGTHDGEKAYNQRQEVINNVKYYLDTYIFKSKGNGSPSDILYRMGNYYLLETDPAMYFNGTKTWNNAIVKSLDYFKEINAQDYFNVSDYIYKCYKEIDTCKFCDNDGLELAKEMKLNCFFAYYMSLSIAIKSCVANDIKTDKRLPDTKSFVAEFEKIWNIKNKPMNVNSLTKFLKIAYLNN